MVKVHAEDQDTDKAPVSYEIYPGWCGFHVVRKFAIKPEE